MNTYHCFFWKQNDHITCIWYRGSKPELLKPRGETSVFLTEQYWKEWEGYTGYLSGQEQIDFCLVYDDSFELPESYEAQMSVPKTLFWTEEKIRECLKMINYPASIELVSPEGTSLMQFIVQGCSKSVRRNFRFRIPSENFAPVLPEAELSPFTAHYVKLAENKHKIKK